MQITHRLVNFALHPAWNTMSPRPVDIQMSLHIHRRLRTDDPTVEIQMSLQIIAIDKVA